MLLGCIADDFTGASDLANTLAKGGMATVQFIGVPRPGDPAACDAGVVALKTRSIAAADAVSQSLAALDWLKQQGCRQYLFKYCSTFDSTLEGNIGPVAEALLDALDAPVAVVCPVFPATGRTLFQGHLFVGDRLLSESGLESHPLNPMTDPDIRRWLSLQCKGNVGLVPYATVRRGQGAISAALEAEAAAGRRLVVVDAVVDEDLLAIGAAIAGHKLVTGGSGHRARLAGEFPPRRRAAPGHRRLRAHRRARRRPVGLLLPRLARPGARASGEPPRACGDRRRPARRETDRCRCRRFRRAPSRRRPDRLFERRPGGRQAGAGAPRREGRGGRHRRHSSAPWRPGWSRTA
jgi:uncharacterized protein YgbK (DUF1537 family)